MLQKNTYLPFRKLELSSLHALFFISLAALILFISTTNVYSAQVTLAWDPNTESDLAGYKIHSGTSSGNYDNVNDVGNQTSYTIQNLLEGQKYYIALTAYDTFNNKSDYSAEVVYTVPILDPTAPSTPTSLQATTITSSRINLSWNASSDNIGVTGYRIYRDGGDTPFATTSTAYPDTGLSSSTTYSYTVSAIDAAGNESGQSPASSFTTLSSLSFNNPPILSPVGNKSVNESQALSFTISATDPDGDTLSYTTNNLPSGASFNDNTKTFAWTPANNQTGTYSNITFQVSDGKDITSESITITVGNINRPPELDTIANITASEGATITLSPTATDPDGDALTYTYTGWMTSNSKTTNYSDSGTHTVTVTVSDGTLTDSQVVAVRVLNKNRAPVLNTIADKNVTETETITFKPTATDPDGDDLKPPVYSGWMSSASYTTTYDDAGTYKVTVTVSDGTLTDSQVVAVRVLNKNRAPVLGHITDITVNEGDTITLSPTATDKDGETLTYTYSDWMNSASYTTTHDDVGEHTVKVTVSDGTQEDSQDVTIIVKDTTLIDKAITAGDIDGSGKKDIVFNNGVGRGIWMLKNGDSNPMKLDDAIPLSITPKTMITGDIDGGSKGDDVIMDIGPDVGIYARLNNSEWSQLLGLDLYVSPKIMTTGDLDANGQDEVIIDVGAPYGVFILWNNSSQWEQLIEGVNTSPEIITTGDLDGNGQDEVIVDIGNPYGVFFLLNNGPSWYPLYPPFDGVNPNASPEFITIGDVDRDDYDDVIIYHSGDDFIWIYRHKNIEWIPFPLPLKDVAPEIITTGDTDGDKWEEIIIDYGDPYGVQIVYVDSRNPEYLTKVSPVVITTSDLTGNDKDEVVVDSDNLPGIRIFTKDVEGSNKTTAYDVKVE